MLEASHVGAGPLEKREPAPSPEQSEAQEIQGFLARIKAGEDFYVEDTQAGWTRAEYVDVSEGGLQGPVVNILVNGEPRVMFPAILFHSQKKYKAFLEKAS